MSALIAHGTPRMAVYEVTQNDAFHSVDIVAAHSSREARGIALDANIFTNEAAAVVIIDVWASGDPRIIASWST